MKRIWHLLFGGRHFLRFAYHDDTAHTQFLLFTFGHNHPAVIDARLIVGRVINDRIQGVLTRLQISFAIKDYVTSLGGLKLVERPAERELTAELSHHLL